MGYFISYEFFNNFPVNNPMTRDSLVPKRECLYREGNTSKVIRDPPLVAPISGG